MNKVILNGRLGHDVSLRYAPKTDTREEMAVARFSLAVKRRRKYNDDTETDWIDCIAFYATAETIKRWFCKGKRIEIVGHIQTRKYDSRKYKNSETGEAARLTAFEVIVDEFEFMDAPTTKGQDEKPEEKKDEPLPAFDEASFKESDDDIPF